MLKKLSGERLDAVLEAGVEEFALHGAAGANMRAIADRAGVSVGALYKYYGDKDGLFRACLDRSLRAVQEALEEATGAPAGMKEYARRVIRAMLRFSREHGGYVRLYCAIAASGGADAAGLAGELEGAAAGFYTRFISAGQDAGDLRRDMDPGMFAFFFDNLLMAAQFAGCCAYYRERFRLYCGGALEEQEERLERELLKFLESAFTFAAEDISHRQGDSMCGEGWE